MRTLLIGGTGFLGRSLTEEFSFSEIISSTTPTSSGEYDLVVCAAPSGKKWLANTNPERDLESAKSLIDRLELIRATRFVLLSTVDVYADVSTAMEDSPLVDESHAYGYHRALVEQTTRDLFSNHLVLRLGGLVGSLLQKNALYDLRNSNNLSQLDKDSQMQFVPVESIYKYLRNTQSGVIGTVNLTAPPVHLGEIAAMIDVELGETGTRASYDVQSVWADPEQKYLVSREESLIAIEKYLLS